MNVPALLPSQRQEEIKRLLSDKQVLPIGELAEHFGVSEMTVRRDLEALAESGMVERVFGGARLATRVAREISHQARLERNREAKEQMAEFAATLVQDGDTVALDCSTSTLYLAKALRDRPITVVTNGLDVLVELSSSRTEVIGVGGTLRLQTHSFVGPIALGSLTSLHTDKAFFSAQGLDAEAGLTDSHLAEVDMKRALLRTARETFALVDSSKLGVVALASVVPLNTLDALITDAPAPDLEGIREQVRVLSVGGRRRNGR
jgi:DeoR/GlpR family transcriptional regulator of sugar metabolism